MGTAGNSIYLSNEWIGKKFNMLTIMGNAGKKGYKYLWKMKCDCGNETVVAVNNVLNGHTMSCGCYKAKRMKDPRKHGMYGTRLYYIWDNMNARCKKGNKAAKYYGNKGISVCNEWKDYKTFFDWAVANGYEDGKNLSIERIDINNDYCPENCKWIDRKLQTRNQSRTHWVEYEGRKMSLAEACEIANISYKAVFCRIKYMNWPVDVALSTPIKRTRNK